MSIFRKKQKIERIWAIPAYVSFELRRITRYLVEYRSHYPEKQEETQLLIDQILDLSHQADILMNGGDGKGIRYDGI